MQTGCALGGHSAILSPSLGMRPRCFLPQLQWVASTDGENQSHASTGFLRQVSRNGVGPADESSVNKEVHKGRDAPHQKLGGRCPGQGAIGPASSAQSRSWPPSRAQGPAPTEPPTRAAEAQGLPHLGTQAQLPSQREAAVRALAEPWAS